MRQVLTKKHDKAQRPNKKLNIIVLQTIKKNSWLIVYILGSFPSLRVHYATALS